MAYDQNSRTDRRREGRHKARIASQLKGVASTRKLLRQVPQAAKDTMADILEASAPAFLAAMKADAPVKTGALRAALNAKVLRKSLRLRVGLVTASTGKKFFYGRILEFGRKAGTASRGGAIAPRPFVLKKRPDLRSALNRRLNKFWENTLIVAAAGVGDD